MDDEKLVYEVEKYSELYDPQHRLYKDIHKKDLIWEAVAAAIGASPEDCKKRWKQLRDAYVKFKSKKSASGSAGGSQKDWRLAHIFTFLDPYLQPRSTKGTLQREPLQEENDLRDEEIGGCSPGSSLQGSRPCTPMSRSSSPFDPRSAATPAPQPTPAPHPRVQALSSGSATATATSKKKRHSQGTSSAAVSVEQQLFEILTAEKASPPLHVPTRKEGMAHYMTSFIPRVNDLPPVLQNRFQKNLLEMVESLEEEAKYIHEQQQTPRPSQLHTTQQNQPPPTIYHGPSFTQSSYHHHSTPVQPHPQHYQRPSQQQQQQQPLSQHGGLKRPHSFLEELEDDTAYQNL